MMGSTKARTLLVEGVPGVGKSTVLDCLVRRHVAASPERKLRTLVHLTQAHTYGPVAEREDAGTLTPREDLEHLQRIVSGLEWLVDSVRTERRTKCFALIDTLHLTHCLRPGVLRWTDVAALDERLAAAGCCLLLLDANDDTVASRSVAARAGTEFIEGYARRRFGPSDADLVRHFRHERDVFRELFAASRMAKLVLSAEASIEDTVSAALRFWRPDVSGSGP